MGRPTLGATVFLPLAVVLFVATACTGPGANRPTCPESREVRCLTPVVCSHDAKRDCDVCACEAPVGNDMSAPARQEPPQSRPEPIR